MDNAQRETAATATANSSNNDCAPIRPFYWEIGDSSAKLASGSIGSAAPVASTSMNIASASKWLYGAYVAQRKNGVLSTTDDVPFLNFTSGYTNFTLPFCEPGGTVEDCLDGSKGAQDSATIGDFFYNSGHMQKHASTLGLGTLDNAGLADEIRSEIGTDIALTYTQPQLAAGVEMTPDSYARFLRKMLSGGLRMGAMLGRNAVCTNPGDPDCTSAIYSPINIDSNESWQYSLGHWVESDPVVGDDAVSSPGSFGFYPWIDSSRTYYGIVAREVSQGYYESVQCGRLIRRAWLTGEAQ